MEEDYVYMAVRVSKSSGIWTERVKKKNHKARKIVGNFWLTPLWQKTSQQNFSFKKGPINQLNRMEVLIKGKYERPAVSERNFCKKNMMLIEGAGLLLRSRPS